MQPTRAVLTILAVAAAGFLAFRGMRGPAPVAPPAGAAPAPEDGATPAEFPTLTGPKRSAAPAAAPRAATAPVPADEEPPPGKPVAAGEDVSLVVPYRTGTKSRYRVTEAQLLRDRGNEMASWWQFIWTISTEVVQGDGTGAARILFKIESFRFQTEGVARRIEFDSSQPDKELLADPELGLARTMNPAMAILGMPLEFSLDTGGRITAIEGVDAMNRKYLDAVDALGAKYLPDATDAPTLESLGEKWSEILFPALGGGTVKGGSPRDTSFRTTYYEVWATLTRGRFVATHADETSFRVEFKGQPAIERLAREAQAPGNLAIVKAHVQSSADSYVNSWCFDRAAGRLTRSRLSAKFQFWVSRSAGVDANGQPIYDPRFTDIERSTLVELLDK